MVRFFGKRPKANNGCTKVFQTPVEVSKMDSEASLWKSVLYRARRARAFAVCGGIAVLARGD